MPLNDSYIVVIIFSTHIFHRFLDFTQDILEFLCYVHTKR